GQPGERLSGGDSRATIPIVPTERAGTRTNETREEAAMERRERETRTRVGERADEGRASSSGSRDYGFDLWGAPCRAIGRLFYELGEAFAPARRTSADRESVEGEEREDRGRGRWGSCNEFRCVCGACDTGVGTPRRQVRERSVAVEDEEPPAGETRRT